jgi:hypothetical protein
MADAASKLTVFFYAGGTSDLIKGAVGSPPTGWTETFYSSNNDLDAMLALGQKYVGKRAALLGVGAVIQYIRVAAFPLVRKTEVTFQVGTGGVGQQYTQSPADNYDPNQVDLLLRLDAANNSRRQLWLAGLPDSQTNTLIEQGMSANFLFSAAFKQYAAFLTANSLGIRQHDRGSGKPGTFTFQAMQRVTPIMVRRRDRGRPFYLFRGRRLA